MKYADWLVQWLENYVRPSVRVRTYERYKLIAEQHIEDKIGGIALDDLSPLVLQRFVTELLQSGNRKTGEGLSASSVNTVISVLQGSLRTAHALGLTEGYAADKIRRPKPAEKPVGCFTLAEQKRIEDAVAAAKRQSCTASCSACTAGCASANFSPLPGAISTLRPASSPFPSPAMTERTAR